MSDRARILLVDDRTENLLALEAILSSLNQVLVRATSGEEALRALLKDEYALILLDVQLPGMDRFETAAQIKARSRTRDIPTIFLTAAFKTDEFQKRGYDVGGADYLTIYGGEAVLQGAEVVGRLRSSGYGYTVKRNIAYSYLPVALAKPGTKLEVEVFGERIAAEVAEDVLHDAKGDRLRV